VYIFLLNRYIEFHAKICTHCCNVNKSHRGYMLYSPCTLNERNTWLRWVSTVDLRACKIRHRRHRDETETLNETETFLDFLATETRPRCSIKCFETPRDRWKRSRPKLSPTYRVSHWQTAAWSGCRSWTSVLGLFEMQVFMKLSHGGYFIKNLTKNL